MPVVSYSDNLHIISINQKKGLPSNLVTDIEKDREGYIWVATFQGIARFDGKQWQHHYHDAAKPDSISSDNTTKLYIDTEDYIWVGTRNSGINKFDKTTHQFKHYLGTRTITGIVQDSDESLWVGTFDNGLYRLDHDGTIIEHFLEKSQINYLNKINDKIFISSEKDGLFRLDNNRLTPLSNLKVYDIHRANNSLETLWFASTTGLYLYNPKSGLAEQFLDKFWVSEIQIRNSKELWLATENSGLILFNIENKSIVQHLKNNNSLLGSVNDNNVKTLLNDNEGVLWVGSSGGINKILTKPFRTYRYSSIGENNVSNNYIRDFSEDRDGNIWIASWGGGIAKFNPNKNHFTAYPSKTNQSLRIAKLVYDRHSHKLWAASQSGLYSFNISKANWEKINFYKTDPNILALTRTQDGTFLISTENNGLFIFDPTQGKVINHYHLTSNNANSPSLNSVNHALEISSGEILISAAEGLSILKHKTQNLQHYIHQHNDTDFLRHKDVLLTLEDRKNQIWLNASGNIFILSKTPEGKIICQNLYEKLGINLNIVSPILEDSLGYIWFSSQKNLFRYNPDNHNLLSFNQADNLPYKSGAERAAFIAQNGDIYISNTTGFIVLDPYKVRPSQLHPPVKISSIKVAGKLHIDTKEVKLHDKTTQLELYFSSLDYKDPSNIQYSYRLDGHDKDWVYNGNNNSVTYTGLPFGRYLFYVKGTNSDGQWSSNIASLSVIVSPPVWKTYSAYALYGTSILIVLLSLNTLINKKKHPQTATEKLKTAEQHNTQTNLSQNQYDINSNISIPASNNSPQTHSIDRDQLNHHPLTTYYQKKNISLNDKKFLNQLYECVSNNYQDNKFGIKQVCEQLCTTKRPLQKKLKSTLGITLTKYMQIYRLEKAAELLRQDYSHSNKQLYETVGFSSQAYFITCFKAHFSVTPKHYAKKKHNIVDS